MGAFPPASLLPYFRWQQRIVSVGNVSTVVLGASPNRVYWAISQPIGLASNPRYSWTSPASATTGFPFPSTGILELKFAEAGPLVGAQLNMMHSGAPVGFTVLEVIYEPYAKSE